MIDEILIELAKRLGIVIDLTKDNSDLVTNNADLVDEIKKEIATREHDRTAAAIVRRASRVADKKTEAAKAYLAGKAYVSPAQQERYERKYEIAKAYQSNPTDELAALLKPEADTVGISVDDLAALIVQMGDQWRQAVAAYSVMIDGGRVAVGKLVDAGKLEQAQWLLDKLSALGADATPADLSALIVQANQDKGVSK